MEDEYPCYDCSREDYCDCWERQFCCRLCNYYSNGLICITSVGKQILCTKLERIIPFHSVRLFCNDYYAVGDEDGNDWLYEVDAWMPLPKGYTKEQNNEH